MLYTGIDLIEIARIERAVARWGDRFLLRIFTPAELAAYRERLPSLAARWAAKEAAAKLLGVGLRGLGSHAFAGFDLRLPGGHSARRALRRVRRRAGRHRRLVRGRLCHPTPVAGARYRG